MIVVTAAGYNLVKVFKAFIEFPASFLDFFVYHFVYIWTQRPSNGLKWTQKWTQFLHKKRSNHNFKTLLIINFLKNESKILSS